MILSLGQSMLSILQGVMTMSDTTKEDKEITMYPEDLTVDCDEVYEGICEELRFRGIEVTKAGFHWTINIELLQEDDDE